VVCAKHGRENVIADSDVIQWIQWWLMCVRRGVVHCESKKQDAPLVSITLRNIKRFSKFFHC